MRKLFIYIILLVSAVAATAQTSYFCDFEDPNECSQWKLNSLKTGAALSTLEQWWFIGDTGNCGANDSVGLFISYDSIDANYKGATTEWVTAYRDVTLTPGSYTIRFDWKFLGKSTDKVVVAWVPTTNKCLSGVGAAIPTAINQYIIGSSSLRGKSAWTQFSSTFSVTTTTSQGRLVFYFFCTQGGAVNPSACIDNIEIVNQACTKPTNLQYNGQTGTLSWQGTGSNYDIRYYSFQENLWHEINNYSGKSYKLNLTEEGYTYFYVRQVCDSANRIHSDWVTTGTFVYIPGKRCVEYMDFGTDKINNAGICYTGEHSSSSSHNDLKFSTQPEKVDNGYQSDASMHTLHYDPNEIDPNSNGGLPTVPDGEIASVRLGAYTSSGKDARIEYKYTVKAGQSDLLDLNYACVLESGGHNADNPFFQLDVLDAKGNQIGGCTHEYFVADMTGSGGGKWHQNGDIWWSNWDKVTVSLCNYVGQTLTIRLTSSRCVYDTHYGYAYFTIGCRSGALEGQACGDFATDHFTAPDGFNYRWKRQDDQTGTIVCRDRTFNIDKQDTTIYTVDIVSKSDANCYYTLVANPNPRFPTVQAVANPKTVDCQNWVDFTEDSYISIINRVSGNVMERSTDPLDGVLIDFGDGSNPEDITDTKKTTHKYPAAGGQFQVKVTASMNDGVCTNDTTITLNLPDLSPAQSQESRQWCRSQGAMEWKGKKYNEDFADTTIFKSEMTGCDSLHIINFRFVDETTSEIWDTICSNDEHGYIFFGDELRKPGQYVHRLDNTQGCDSVITLNLHVNQALEVRTEPEYALCADAQEWEIPFEVHSGTLDGVELTMRNLKDTLSGLKSRYFFAAGAPVVITWTSDLRAGIYPFHIRFISPWCGSPEGDIQLTVDYPSSVLEQFVGQGFFQAKNELYNDGYKIVGFQWCRNGQPIPGATQSYYYKAHDTAGAEYTCLLTGEDGVTLPACPLYYGYETALADVEPEQQSPKFILNGKLYIRHNGAIYDAAGRKVK